MTRDAVLIQHAWPPDVNPDYVGMLEMQLVRNAAYCERWGFDYRPIIANVKEEYADPHLGEWPKVELIRLALADGFPYVVWMDPDALIRDFDADLRDGCPAGLGACWQRIPQMNHWNTGLLYMQNTAEVRGFIDDWQAKFPGERMWKEQGEFNRLAKLSRVVTTISDRWNATLNYSMVPDAVVLGFHGSGSPAERLALMRATLSTYPDETAGAGVLTDGNLQQV
jgi:hypothetical protein